MRFFIFDIMEDVLNTEWPDIEVEEKFDWSLSLKDIHHRYGQPKKIRRKKELHSRWPVDTGPSIKISKQPSAKAISIIKQTPGLTLTEFIDKLTAEAEPSFHCE